MEPKVILTTLVIVIILGTILYYTVFKKSEEPEPEEELEELEEIEEEEVTKPSPDTIDDVMTGGDDEPIPDEDETSLETAPAEDEVEEEITNEVSPYMIKK